MGSESCELFRNTKMKKKKQRRGGKAQWNKADFAIKREVRRRAKKR